MSHVTLPPHAEVTEKDFQAQVIDLAKLLRWQHYHTWNSQRSAAGFPDLVLVRPPRLVFAELKTEVGKVHPAQRRWQDLLGRCGAEVWVWRPHHLADGTIGRCLSHRIGLVAETGERRTLEGKEQPEPTVGEVDRAIGLLLHQGILEKFPGGSVLVQVSERGEARIADALGRMAELGIWP